MWRDPFGIGGIAIAASVLGAVVYTGGELAAVGLDVEASEVVRAIAEWAHSSARVRALPLDWPRHMLGAGGRVVVVGEVFMRGVYEGKIRCARKGQEGRAKDKQELGTMPEWWATRREDLDRQIAEEQEE